MNRTLTTALAAATILTLAPAAKAESVTVSKNHVAHQLASSKSAQERLQMHSDRFCSDHCKRFEVDVTTVNQALQNLANQAYHGTSKDGTLVVDYNRVAHQFRSVRSALERMKWVADRQDDARRKRVQIDVAIVDAVVQNVENHLHNSYKAQKRAKLAQAKDDANRAAKTAKDRSAAHKASHGKKSSTTQRHGMFAHR